MKKFISVLSREAPTTLGSSVVGVSRERTEMNGFFKAFCGKFRGQIWNLNYCNLKNCSQSSFSGSIFLQMPFSHPFPIDLQEFFRRFCGYSKFQMSRQETRKSKFCNFLFDKTAQLLLWSLMPMKTEILQNWRISSKFAKSIVSIIKINFWQHYNLPPDDAASEKQAPACPWLDAITVRVRLLNTKYSSEYCCTKVLDSRAWNTAFCWARLTLRQKPKLALLFTLL
jgi:hypothetical protein